MTWHYFLFPWNERFLYQINFSFWSRWQRKLKVTSRHQRHPFILSCVRTLFVLSQQKSSEIDNKSQDKHLSSGRWSGTTRQTANKYESYPRERQTDSHTVSKTVSHCDLCITWLTNLTGHLWFLPHSWVSLYFVSHRIVRDIHSYSTVCVSQEDAPLTPTVMSITVSLLQWLH